MNIYIAENSTYQINETRDKRWAVPYSNEATNARAEILLENNIKYIKVKNIRPWLSFWHNGLYLLIARS